MHRSTGFTLVECAVVCAVVALAAGLALPSLQGSWLRMARLDAVDALTRVQAAQEAYRMLHGGYAADLSALRGVAVTSAQGRYAVALQPGGADGYRAVAHALGAQLRDQACPALVLQVSSGFAAHGPHPGCWNR